MKKRRRRRKRRIRITWRGYVVLAVLLLLLAFGIRVGVVALSRHLEDVGVSQKKDPAAATGAAQTEDGLATPVLVTLSPVTPPVTPSPDVALATTGARLPTAEEEKGAVEGVIRTSNVALRKGADTSYDKIYKYNVGERVLVYARENGFYLIKVLSDERYGFMSVDFVTKFGVLPGEAGATPMPTAIAGTVMGFVNVDELKLRSVPSTENNTPLGLCREFDLLWIYYQTDGFYYVEVASTGQRGYVFAEYVMVRAEIPTGTPGVGAAP